MSRSRSRTGDRRPAGPPALRTPRPDTLSPEETDEVRDLVADWLPLPDVAERLDLDIMRVRRLVADGDLAAVRVDGVVQVPAAFLVEAPGGHGAAPLPELRGTLTVLEDAGYTTAEAVRWLFTPDPTLVEGRPVDTLRAGRKTEIRRRAQALGF
ncbi:Rv2175c family DNA-binding protein [Aquipuribacter nitratireducens]|uniref:Rv2175c family DNA-binding protein n=1 Tax=Aquipuribacter nitratireducens TaxID=650104 RepID=A0ABW0GQI5_9MICO